MTSDTEKQIAAAINAAEDIADPPDALAEQSRTDPNAGNPLLLTRGTGMTSDPLVQAQGESQPDSNGETTEQTFERLAALSPVNYDRVREKEAERLDIRMSTLDAEVKNYRETPQDTSGGRPVQFDEIEPWPERVDGDTLPRDIKREIARFVVASDDILTVAALWCVHAHCYDLWQHTPRLEITSPEKGSGKSTFLDVLSHLVPRSIRTENVSTAVLFRVIEKYAPTIFLDEADTFLRDDEDLRGCLNAGHRRGGKHLRCVGDQHEVHEFNTFAPVATAAIGRLPATLADRSIRCFLARKKADEQVEDFNFRQTAGLKKLARMCARWVDDNRSRLGAADPEMPPGIFNRVADNWRVLLAIADVAGGDWPIIARQTATRLSSESNETSIRTELLADIQTIFRTKQATCLTGRDICDALVDLADRPWAEWRRGKPITATGLARQLGAFDIKSKNVRFGESVKKGYQRSVFEDAFSRYLPCQTATTATALKNSDNSPSQNATYGDNVALRCAEMSNEPNDVAAMALRTGGNGETDEERAAIRELDGGMSREEAERLSNQERQE